MKEIDFSGWGGDQFVELEAWQGNAFLYPPCCIQLYDSCALVATLVPLTLSKHINSPLPPVALSPFSLSLFLSGLGPHGNRFETRLDVDSSLLPFHSPSTPVGRRKTGAANRYPTMVLPSMHLRSVWSTTIHDLFSSSRAFFYFFPFPFFSTDSIRSNEFCWWFITRWRSRSLILYYIFEMSEELESFGKTNGSTHHFKLAYQHAIDPYDSFIIFQTIQLPWFRMKRKNNSHRYHWTSRINRLHVTLNIQIYPISSQKDLSDPSELEKSLSIFFSPDALRIRLSSIHPFQITKLSNAGNRSTRWPLLITKTAYVPRF